MSLQILFSDHEESIDFIDAVNIHRTELIQNDIHEHFSELKVIVGVRVS